MAPITNHVSLSITVDSVGLTRAGFGTPLYASQTAAWAERTREYASLAEVAVDFPVTNSPEYLFASAVFSQNPAPEKCKIGRCALPATKVVSISVAAVRNSYTYEIDVDGDGVTAETVSFTSDGTATDAEIAAGLVSALNAVTGKNFTASGAASPITITGDAAGEWFSLAVNPNDLSLTETTADPGIATDLAAIALEDSDWYALYTAFNSNAYVDAANAWVEAADKKIYIADSNDTASVTAAAGGGDTIDDLKTNARARTAGFYAHNPAEMAGAAWLGRVLPLDPGSESWKFKSLSGVSVQSLTSTQRSNLTGKNGNGYETVAGKSFTFNGTMGDGEFIDVQRFIDWLDDDMTKGVLEVLLAASKVPFTDEGIAMIENAIRGSLDRGVEAGGITAGSITVTVPKASSVSVANKSARILPDVKFSATLAGAIHKVDLTGVVSV